MCRSEPRTFSCEQNTRQQAAAADINKWPQWTSTNIPLPQYSGLNGSHPLKNLICSFSDYGTLTLGLQILAMHRNFSRNHWLLTHHILFSGVSYLDFFSLSFSVFRPSFIISASFISRSNCHGYFALPSHHNQCYP